MLRQMMFSIDLNRCINCKTCEMACNNYYGLTGPHRRKVISYERSEKLNPIELLISCNHCNNPICVSVCPHNNFQKRWDGIVVHEANNCKACMRCITACPFHAPKLNPKMNRADKCNFCVERIDQDLTPICIENCVTGALSIMEVTLSERNDYSINKADIPIATYTNPSIYVIENKRGYTFFRKDDNEI